MWGPKVFYAKFGFCLLWSKVKIHNGRKLIQKAKIDLEMQKSKNLGSQLAKV